MVKDALAPLLDVGQRRAPDSRSLSDGALGEPSRAPGVSEPLPEFSILRLDLVPDRFVIHTNILFGFDLHSNICGSVPQGPRSSHMEVTMTAPRISHDDLAAFAARAVNLPKTIADDKRKQVNALRERLTSHIAKNPGFSLVKMLHAGSVAKGTALRTFNDFDVAVYVKKDDAPVTEAELIEWIADRLREAYKGLLDPSQIEPGTHCVNVQFKSSGTQVDVVPVLYEGDPDDRGYLIAKDSGDRLLTSVRLHLDFVRMHKNACPDDWAQVIRLVKWWIREQKMNDETEQFRFKSFMAELICAHLLDKDLITFEDYPVALEGFFDYVVRTELTERIAFTEHYTASALPSTRINTIEIFDPVNADNNVARLYDTDDQKRIVLAAEKALDAITEAHYATTKAQAVECWQVVFGSRFQGRA